MEDFDVFNQNAKRKTDEKVGGNANEVGARGSGGAEIDRGSMENFEFA